MATTERFAAWSRSCLTMQGCGALGEEERKSLWLGIRFAPALCFAGIALGAVLAVAFLMDLTAAAWLLAVPLLVVAATVATTNWCLPSLMYGLLHGRRAGEPAR